MGAPFTCNFMAELVGYIALGSVNWVFAIVVAFIMLVLTSFYNLLLLYRVLYSKSFYYKAVILTLNRKVNDLNLTEISCLVLLLSATLFFGLNPDSLSYFFRPWL